MITLNPRAQAVYSDMHLALDGTRDAETGARCAACIVFLPGQAPLAFTKTVRSRSEASLRPGSSPFHTFEMTAQAGKLEVQVLTCIEALRERAQREKHSVARLVVIPAFSASTSDFYGKGDLLLLEGKCSLFANIAEFGESKAFARAEAANFWFTARDGSRPVPKGSEALLVLEGDLEKQFEVRKSSQEHTAVTDLRIYPLLYPTDSPEAQQYSEVVDLAIASKLSLQDINRLVAPFTGLASKVFPPLLKQKLEHLVGHAASDPERFPRRKRPRGSNQSSCQEFSQ